MHTDNNPAPTSRGYNDQKFADSVKLGVAPKSVLVDGKTRRVKRSDVDTWRSAGAQTAYSSNGDSGAVRR
jgi:hypothetical protein